MWYNGYFGGGGPLSQSSPLEDTKMSKQEGTQGTQATEEKAEAKIVIRPDVSNYTSSRSASGAKSQHSGDAVAIAIAGFSVDQVFAVLVALSGKDSDITAESLAAKYGHLNVGQQRMTAGNRIRGLVKKASTGEGNEGKGEALLEKLTGPVRKSVDKAIEAAVKAKADAKAEKAEAAELKKVEAADKKAKKADAATKKADAKADTKAA